MISFLELGIDGVRWRNWGSGVRQAVGRFLVQDVAWRVVSVGIPVVVGSGRFSVGNCVGSGLAGCHRLLAGCP